MSSGRRTFPISLQLACLSVLLPALSTVGKAQPNPLVNRSGTLSMMPVYQQWRIGATEVSEFTVPIALDLQLNRSLRFGLTAARATAEGDGITRLSSFGDTQAHLSFRRPVGSSSLVLSLGAGLPSGKSTLSNDELGTTALISRDLFNFRLPHFGAGTNVLASLSLAFPIGEHVVGGIGGALQHQGTYTPLAGLDYDPADEATVTAGFDVRLSPNTTITGDLAATIYGPDRLSGLEAFTPGARLITTVRFRQFIRFDEFSIIIRFRSRRENALSSVFARQGLLFQRAAPNQFVARIRYRKRIQKRFYLTGAGELTVYEETPAALDGLNHMTLGIAPELQLTRAAGISGRVRYAFGGFKNDPRNIRGLEAGAGLVIRF